MRRPITGTPVVSILMAVADGAYLAPAMESLLAQSLDDLELVVVDDGADPDTAAAIEAWAARDARVVAVRNPHRLGLPAALNRGLARCRAPLVARADADDVYHPDRLARQVPVFARRPALGALSCGYRRIDAAGRPSEIAHAVTGPALLRFRLMFLNPLLHPGVVFRTDLVRALGGYDERFWTAQDTDLWARLSARAEIDNLPEPLVDWRKHGASQLATRGEAGRALSTQISTRLQSAYLGHPVAPERAGAARETWRAFAPVAPGMAREGERALAILLARAREREPKAVLADFHATTARALARHARWLAPRAPATAATLVARALRWRLGTVGHPTPEPARAADARQTRADAR